MEQADLSLVRLVAARYEELQGLGRVVDASSLLCLWSLLTIDPNKRSPVPFVAAITVWACLTFWSAGRVARYYRERFGRTTRVRQSGGTIAAVHLSTQLIWMTMVFGGFFVPLLAVYAGYVALRDRPYRAQWMLLAVEGIVFTVAYAGLHSPASFAEWHSRFVLTAAPILVVVGLLDHRLLVRAMHRAADPTPDTEHADSV